MEIAPKEASRLLQQEPERHLLLDCRTPEEWAIARVQGSMLVPMADIAGRLEELTEHDHRTILVLCHHGVRSLRVAAFLRQNGFDSALSIAGGIDRWAAEVDPGVGVY